MLLDRFKALLQDPPPAMAFEISEAGIAAARINGRAELEFRPFKPGTLSVSPMKENIVDPDDFTLAVRSLAGAQPARKRKDVALILPDYSARVVELDFDDFPSDPKAQLALLRLRLKRGLPFDVESAAVSYWAQPAADKKTEVVVAVAPLEIVSRYEAPFRAAGMYPGLVTTSSLAALNLVPATGLVAVAKLAGRVLSVMIANLGALRLVRCLELPSTDLEEVAGVLIPTFAFVEDNLGRKPERLMLCGFGARAGEAGRRFRDELGVEAEPLQSPLGTPGEHNAGLLGYLRSIGRNVQAEAAGKN
jgi:type IV pilus assembly protein PilM